MTLKVCLALCFATLLISSVLSGCSGTGTPPPNPSPTPVGTPSPSPNPTPIRPTPTPTPTPTGTLQSVNHIVFMMQENRTFDSYFGKINDVRAAQGLGRDVDTLDTVYSQQADDGSTIANYHFPTVCTFNSSQAWLESHGDVNRDQPADGNPVLMNGFAHTAAGDAAGSNPDTKGVRIMGFYTQSDLPSPYFFATQFATSDRWYAPAPNQ